VSGTRARSDAHFSLMANGPESPMCTDPGMCATANSITGRVSSTIAPLATSCWKSAIRNDVHTFGEELPMPEQCADGLDECSSRIRFQHVPVRAGVQHLADDLIGFVHGQDEDFGRHGTPNLARGLQPIQLRHADVENHDIGLQVDGLGYRFAARARFPADDPSRPPFQYGAYALTHDVVIVGDEDTDWPHGVSVSIGTRTRTVVPLSVNSTSKLPPN